jgi:hypothetical protein
LCARIASRNRRLTQFRVTASPTFFDTVNPTRGLPRPRRAMTTTNAPDAR